MAYAKIVHEWSDGQVTAMEVGGDLEDLTACVVAAIMMWRECVDASE